MAMERSFFTCTRSLSQALRSPDMRRAAARSFSTTLRSALQPQTPSRQRRGLHCTPPNNESRDPRSMRDPPSAENTQADFAALDVLRNTVTPATSIDACTSEGFALNNNMRISGCGVLLIGGEAYRWRPWLKKETTMQDDAAEDYAMTGQLLNAKGQWEVPDEAWGLLDMVWPKPGTT
jgi:NADH dehydrogenase [ubiquinone] 1 alpha subcomplex assembly factor 3